MDGIAVSAGCDVVEPGRRFRVATTLFAGDEPHGGVSAEPVEIMTGAALPGGLDTVVPFELFVRDGESVEITAAVSRGANVRQAGEDVTAGDVVVAGGHPLNAFELGSLAAAGVRQVQVSCRPRVALIVTGSEIASGLPLQYQIPDSAGPMVRAAALRIGAEVVGTEYVADDLEGLAEAFRRASRVADVILTVGGLGRGHGDLVAAIAGSLGDVTSFSLALKPGKPFAAGTIDGAAYCGLPGNPGAAIVGFELLVAPLLRKLAHHTEPGPTSVPGVAATDVTRKPDGRLYALRSLVEVDSNGRLVATPLGGQGSHQLREAAAANAILLLGDGVGVRRGELVDVLLLAPPGGAAR
jgi:molybdopterin molybdotransferase